MLLPRHFFIRSSESIGAESTPLFPQKDSEQPHISAPFGEVVQTNDNADNRYEEH
jgi:hypothetical protein